MNRKTISLFFTGAFFAGLIYLFAWSSIFTVSEVVVTGVNQSLIQDSIIKVAAIKNGEKLARVEPRAIWQKIQSQSWIASSHISRDWISGKVTIRVVPRKAVAIYNGHSIDATGMIFDLPGNLMKSAQESVLPIVSSSDSRGALEAAALYQSLPSEISKSVSSVTSYSGKGFSLHLLYEGRDIKVMWGSADKIDLKVRVLQALLALKENSSVKRIDISAPHAPIVK